MEILRDKLYLSREYIKEGETDFQYICRLIDESVNGNKEE